MSKPNHYHALKAVLEAGTLASIRDISLIVPITTLTRDMKLNYNTISKRILDPARFTVADIYRLAKLTGVGPDRWLDQIGREIDKRRG